MEFWGVEVKYDESFTVQPGEGKVLHLRQANLDQKIDSVRVYVEIDKKKLLLGTLDPVRQPQLAFDLIFDKEFHIFHNSRYSSVYFLGYIVPQQRLDESKSFVEVVSVDKSAHPILNQVVKQAKTIVEVKKEIDESDDSQKGAKNVVNKPNPKSAEGSIKCEICYSSFESELSLEHSLRCSECKSKGRPFSSKAALHAHFKAKHTT